MRFSISELLLWIIVGAAAGWLFTRVVRGSSFGFFGNSAIGIIGAVAGGWLFQLTGVQPPIAGTVGSGLTATIGAIALISLLRTFTENR